MSHSLPERILSIPANLGLPMTSGPAPAPGPTGAIAGSALPIRRAEELIRTLPGVLSVRIVPGETGAIDEVHVLTTDAVPPKATVRNIESALMAQLGLRVNHRKISIATTLDAPRATDLPPAAVAAVVSAPVASAAAGPEAVGSPVAVSTPAASASAGGLPPGGLVAAAVAASGAAVLGGAPALVASPMVATAVAASPVAATPGAVASPVAPPFPALTPHVERPAEGERMGARDGRPTRGGAAAAEGRRLLIFEDVEVRRSRTKGVLCRVTLNRDGTLYVGESEGQETERSRVELAARATISAITQAVTAASGGERSLSLEGAKRFDAFDREFIFVSVAARIGRELAILTGSCEVRESAETSAVLSVLDATNRWVHLER